MPKHAGPVHTGAERTRLLSKARAIPAKIVRKLQSKEGRNSTTNKVNRTTPKDRTNLFRREGAAAKAEEPTPTNIRR